MAKKNVGTATTAAPTPFTTPVQETGPDNVPYLRACVEQASSEAKEPVSGEQAGPGSVPSSEGVRPAAPAEQITDDMVERGTVALINFLADTMGKPHVESPDELAGGQGVLREEVRAILNAAYVVESGQEADQ